MDVARYQLNSEKINETTTMSICSWRPMDSMLVPGLCVAKFICSPVFHVCHLICCCLDHCSRPRAYALERSTSAALC